MPRAALVFNPGAGNAGALDALQQRLAPYFELVVFEPRTARAARDVNPDLVIAAGGDGTVSLVAGALVGSSIPLGVIGLGTSNSIAAALGIPTDDVGWLETLVCGERLVLDTARANGRPMLLHASVGFHAATVNETSSDAKKRWGALAYVAEGVAKLTDLEPFEVEVETEAETMRGRAVNVTAANVAPRKTVLAQGPSAVVPNDGLLDVTIVAASGFVEAVATGMHLFATAGREPATRSNVGYLSARRLRIETSPAQPIVIDGEPGGEGRLVVECVPQSLVVLVPRQE